jgi:ribose/xylose/arabinose/galactoside ABC-type transport system permease subunit
MRLIKANRNTSLLALIAIIIVTMGLLKGTAFLNYSNFEAILTGMSYDLLFALGMTVVLIQGGIDLSVGSVMAFTGIVTTLLLQKGVAVPLAVASGLTTAMAIGLANGLLVAKLSVAPFVATLSSMSIFRGMGYVMTSGYFVNKLPATYVAFGRGRALGLPNTVLLSIALCVVFAVLVTRIKFFKQMFYIGSSSEASFLSGLPTAFVTIIGYIICSLTAGLAAIMMTSHLAMGHASFGIGAEMRAIAAAVVGGASLAGGKGSILVTSLGVILVALINNAFIMLNGSQNWQSAISGIILIVALALNLVQERIVRTRGVAA